jgi:hypothetical protein
MKEGFSPPGRSRRRRGKLVNDTAAKAVRIAAIEGGTIQRPAVSNYATFGKAASGTRKPIQYLRVDDPAERIDEPKDQYSH